MATDVRVRRYIGGPVDETTAIAKAHRKVTAPAWGEFVVVERATSQIAGSGTLARKRGPWELSLQLGHGYWGRGYALETVLLIRDWFFQHTNEDLLIATTQRANEACRRLLQRAGGRFVGTFEQYDRVQERYDFHRHTPPAEATPSAVMERRLPVAYLLVGLTGSGKTTYAKRVLEPAGVIRLSVDERVFARHGRYGVDYPEHTYFEKEGPVLVEVRAELRKLLRDGRDVVIDHGLWRRPDRNDWKAVVASAGGQVRLLYFPVSKHELLRRLNARNTQDHANALLVTAEALDDFYARFDEPDGEDEQVVPVGSF
ncbi:GNAT family N-acetyltransferase [Actinoplanes flavus]|nr:GNAT family N-acetyltransferase [Actinoplanes flavus]